MGMFVVPLPPVEIGIAFSVLVLGSCIALSVRAPPWAACLIVALFAVFHGYAHGAEMPQSATWQYGLGFVMATAVLHGAGLLASRSLNKQAVWIRAVGTVVAASGAWMLATI